MSDLKEIWLAPTCHEDGDGRQWCQDDVWGDDCGCGIEQHLAIRYVLAADYDALLSRAKTAEADFLAAAVDERENKLMNISADIQTDRAYIDGMKAGWNFAQADDENGYARAVNGRLAEIRDVKPKAVLAAQQKESGDE